MKIFTMVKGEVDIVEDWVLYHGSIAGFENLFVIDNYSRDGTFKKLLELKKQYNINLMRRVDYKKKGDYMTEMLQKFGNGEIVFPIDIDEFIVYYNDDNTISCDINHILNYLETLPELSFYKMNYIQAKILINKGYKRATVECEYGEYDDYKGFSKTFFNSRLFDGVIDHGNHYKCNDYFLSNLCLVHFHERNLDQIKKKVYNNVKGLGYNPFDLNSLLNLKNSGCSLMGFHHVNKQIQILKNNFQLNIKNIESNDISLTPLNNKILELKN